MNRAEYELKKAELAEKKRAISAEMDKLAEGFHDEELKEYQQKYNGQYIIEHAREPRLIGSGPTIFSHFIIHYIKNVTFIGGYFFRYEGECWEVDYDVDFEKYGEGGITVKHYIEDGTGGGNDCHFKSNIISKEDAQKLLTAAKQLSDEIFATFK